MEEIAPLLRDEVLQLLKDHGPKTREEISHALDMKIQTVCPTVFDLRRQGFIMDTELLRPTVSGRMAHVLAAV